MQSNATLCCVGMVLFVSSCVKKSAGSAPASLTQEEMAACKYNGQRFLLIVAPEPAFQGDISLIQDNYVKYMPHPLINLAYINKLVQNDPGKQALCAQYYAMDQSKYDIFGVLAVTFRIK